MSGKELDQKLEELIQARIVEAVGVATKNSQNVFRHVVEKNHDDWKYSYESSIGPADNRHVVKTRGDDQTTVIQEHNAAIEKLATSKEKE